MARATKLPLQERVPLPRTAWKLADLAVLSLLLALLAHRAASLLAVTAGGAAPACTWCWLAALVCEAWFFVVWLLNMNAKWNPVRFDTHPERLAQRQGANARLTFVFTASSSSSITPRLNAGFATGPTSCRRWTCS